LTKLTAGFSQFSPVLFEFFFAGRDLFHISPDLLAVEEDFLASRAIAQILAQLRRVIFKFLDIPA
jgi:hypothetical protein